MPSDVVACPQDPVFFHHPTSGAETALSCSRVEMAGGWHYVGLMPGGSQQSKVTAEVPPGYVYLLSDNREFHDDSRDFGAVPQESCDHVVFFRLWGVEGFKDAETRLSAIH
jgi:signal peptidase I